jgi:hypothetical protein
MTGDFSPLHFGPDELDAWLAGVRAPELVAHLNTCSGCREMLRGEEALLAQLAALPAYAPRADFGDRVMAAVRIPDPFAIRALQTAQRRLFASRRSVAIAAMVALVLLGSMAASAAWTLANRDSLLAAGNWLAGEAGRWAWVGLRGAALNLIEQPWFSGFRSLVDAPLRLAVASAAMSLMYVSGILALRRLLAVPTQRVAHANR